MGEKLHDDGRGYVRHDADGEYREATERASREHVEHVEDGAALLIEEQSEGDWIDSGHGNEGPDPVDDKRPEHEQQAVLELCGGAAGGFGRARHQLSCTLPPAASMAARAPGVTATPLTTTALSSLPAAMILTRLARLAMIFAARSASRSTVSAST